MVLRGPYERKGGDSCESPPVDVESCRNAFDLAGIPHSGMPAVPRAPQRGGPGVRVRLEVEADAELELPRLPLIDWPVTLRLVANASGSKSVATAPGISDANSM